MEGVEIVMILIELQIPPNKTQLHILKNISRVIKNGMIGLLN